MNKKKQKIKSINQKKKFKPYPEPLIEEIKPKPEPVKEKIKTKNKPKKQITPKLKRSLNLY